jgi:hypothetical protein
MEIAINAKNVQATNSIHFASPHEKIKILVDALRLVSSDPDIKIKTLIIPDECEKYGFVEGEFDLGVLLHFMADMLEE